MNKKGRFTVFLSLLALLVSGVAYAGNLNQTNPPSDSGTAMYTLENIYNRLLDGTEGTKRGVHFAGPSSGPTAGTGHTLDDIYNLIRALVPKTGQTTQYVAGDDGDLQKGFPLSGSRFTDNNDGTVTDNLTGLTWLKDADCMGNGNWGTGADKTFDVISRLNGVEDFSCDDYTAGTHTDWRLPTVRELQSLIDYGVTTSVKLPSGHPFIDVKEDYYWSSTTYAVTTTNAWNVGLDNGYVNTADKAMGTRYVWPVR
ncbi:DUF1566 domain-containing protein [Desulfonema magnum]|uniref:DUF1566 n=1 Tax=Desulfonema magnum TaxID=45655 RepID=A0A975BTY6_9BACT|nr:DUF1566 domain-containing protein [Desulfonema magnum]QTA91472.1 DUF1566 [Desulfonema magnum]